MATIINNPPSNTVQTPSNQENDSNWALMVIFFIVLIILVFYFGLPLLRRATVAPQINVPGKIDINVNTPKNGGNGGTNSAPSSGK